MITCTSCSNTSDKIPSSLQKRDYNLENKYRLLKTRFKSVINMYVFSSAERFETKIHS